MAPQLPLYALANERQVAALVFAKVRLGDCALVGLSDNLEFTAGSVPGINVKPIAAHRSTKEWMPDWQDPATLLAT